LLVLADSGGSNSCTSWAWKTEIQAHMCNAFGITVTIAHYPTGASKWNPIEHRLFSEISKNWAAEPLDSYEKMLHFIRYQYQNWLGGDCLPRPKRVSHRSQTRPESDLRAPP